MNRPPVEFNYVPLVWTGVLSYLIAAWVGILSFVRLLIQAHRAI